MSYRTRSLLILLLLLASVYGVGLGTRRVVLDAQEKSIGSEIPFTLESALYYRRVKMIADRGNLGATDPMIAYPEGIQVRKAYTYGAEPFHAYLARILPGKATFADKVRWIHAAWFCVSIPALAFFVFLLTGRLSAGVVSGLFYAVSISAVMRSTGQELSHENAAIPWLTLHWVADALALRWGRSRRGWDAAVLSAICLAAALWMWDMIQFYIAIWAVGMMAHLWLRKTPVDSWWQLRRGLQIGFILCVAILNPYYRSHGLPLSPLIGLLIGVGIFMVVRPHRSRRASLAAASLPVAVTTLLGSWTTYGQSYSHFTHLLWAKLRHANVKPADPSLLSFDERVMWVPSLHSADWGLTVSIFPAMFAVVPLALIALVRYGRKPPFPSNFHFTWYVIVSSLAFVLFVRFHTYVALFAAVVLGLSLAWVLQQKRFWLKIAWSVVLVSALWTEASHTLSNPERWGRPNVYYREMQELTDWLEKHVSPYPVMANMGVSGAIAAYGKCAIVLHPKFETKLARERYRQYGELLFGESEEAFRDFLDDLGVRHYVYSLGEFASVQPEYQMRYFVDRMDPSPDSPARKFEEAPESLNYFYPLFANRKYAVYTMRTRGDEQAAEVDLTAARVALEEGRIDEAEALALGAWRTHPERTEALGIAGRAAALREQGFHLIPESE